MRLFALLAFVLILWLPGGASAQTPQERARLEWALERGRLLFELDRAAWVTTDDLVARLRDPGREGIRGYIVEPDGAGFVVTYYAFGEEDLLHAVYRGRVENRRVVAAEVYPSPSRRPLLTADQRRMVVARAAASEVGRRPCGRSFNTVVIPPADSHAPVELYLLTPQTDARIYPFGGHFRATVAADGEILDSRAFTNTCLAMPVNEGNKRPAALMVTHLLDPIPTEIHVFMSIWTGLPIMVGTENGRGWEVTPEAIRLIGTD